MFYTYVNQTVKLSVIVISISVLDEVIKILFYSPLQVIY